MGWGRTRLQEVLVNTYISQQALFGSVIYSLQQADQDMDPSLSFTNFATENLLEELYSWSVEDEVLGSITDDPLRKEVMDIFDSFQSKEFGMEKLQRLIDTLHKGIEHENTDWTSSSQTIPHSFEKIGRAHV